MLRTLVAGFIVIAAIPAAAQTSSTAPRAALDLVAGYTGLMDENLIGHTAVSGTFRYHLTPKVSIGPEVTFMAGPGNDRDLFVTGNLVWDFLARDAAPRPGTVSPYLVLGGGLMRYTNSFGGRSFSTVEGAVTAGGGLRVWISDRVYALGEYRIGWEPHARVTGGIGVAW